MLNKSYSDFAVIAEKRLLKSLMDWQSCEKEEMADGYTDRSLATELAARGSQIHLQLITLHFASQ